MSDQPSTEVYCPHCLERIDWTLPDLPLFTIEEAMAVIPVASRNAFYQMLWRYKRLLDSPRDTLGDYGRRYRLLTAAEIKLLNRRIKLTMRGVRRWFRAGYPS